MKVLIEREREKENEREIIVRRHEEKNIHIERGRRQGGKSALLGEWSG